MSRDWMIGPEEGIVGHVAEPVHVPRLTTHQDTVPQFLADAVNASAASGYPCLAVLIARTADARALQQQLWTDHVSIDDLTGEHILVILPYKRTNSAASAETPGVLVEARHAEVRAGTLTMPGGAPAAWAQEFWKARIRRLRSPQGKLSDAQRRGTETARETRVFFGVPERMLPCLALMTLWEQEVRILRMETAANLYQLLRDIVSEWEEAAGPGPWEAGGQQAPARPSFGACVDRVAAAQRYQPADLVEPLRMPQFPSWRVQVWQSGGLRPLTSSGDRS